ncbi:MAG TPA: hypothetical protein PK014_11625 [Thermoanaerobaculia bacterium]|nr:hypothetical protein [Thermoanaerobaculia bacterium]HUM30783.1 hypothetical protein [Thermoanaerobaculia bacterium]HXK69017.1 hypothetical protein [Thermoanaerobaculia bacterium]
MLNLLKRPLDRQNTSQYILTRVLIPLGILFFYLLLSSAFLPGGINRVFIRNLIPIVTLVLVLLSATFVTLLIMRKIPFRIKTSADIRFSPLDLSLLLFPLTPVAQYMIHNANILFWYDYFYIAAFFILFVSVPLLFIPYLFRFSGSTGSLISLGLAYTYTITDMASLAAERAWHFAGYFPAQLALFAGLWIFFSILFHFKLRTFLYTLITIYFISNGAFQFYSRDTLTPSNRLNSTNNALVKLVNNRKPEMTPNIYLLIYDAYVGCETLSAHGIDNRDQEKYLEDHGFTIYPLTYSVAAFSVGTMSRVFNVSFDYYGKPRKGISGDGVVQNLLKKFGYETYGIFPSSYFFQGIHSSYDHSVPGDSFSTRTLVRAIFVGEFRFDIDFDYVSRTGYVEKKREIFSFHSTIPRLLYTHSNIPSHSQNSGKCQPDEVKLYAERLKGANREMRGDIDILVKHDPEAIVIIAGDHGPYLTKNCEKTGNHYDISEINRLDIQDRYGTFLAIRWPASDFDDYDNIVVLQDLFPSIFAYMWKDPGLLDSRIEPITTSNTTISGAYVSHGVIYGGINDGEALFVDSADP